MTKEIFVRMAIKSWDIQVKSASKFFDSIDDASLSRQVAPGKNSILYLLGHLVAVNDGMISLFGLGERQYASLDEAFVKNPDNAGIPIPNATTLKAAWRKSNETLSSYFEKMSADDWFARHNSMTDQDLINDPGRNKLSVLLNRTNHLSYHLGQLVLAKEKND
jgi:uncharacterized damage-inducible protein DinB